VDEKEYIIPYSEEARKRNYHKTRKGKVIRFVVQLEVKYEGDWKEVVRYDCVHGFAHRDSCNLRGKNKKDELYLGFEDALSLADDDVDDNWEIYKLKFFKGRNAMNVMERKNTELIKEFNRYIREHPEYADSIPDNAVVVMQLEGDRKFNQWSLDLARSYAEKGQHIVYVKIKKLRPIRSRIEELEVAV